MTLGQKIKKLRKQKGFTLLELGAMADCTKSYIHDIESDRLHKPGARRIMAIAHALDVTVEYLLNDKRCDLTSAQEQAFFHKLGKLSKYDRNKIMQIINLWSKKQ